MARRASRCSRLADGAAERSRRTTDARWPLRGPIEDSTPRSRDVGDGGEICRSVAPAVQRSRRGLDAERLRALPLDRPAPCQAETSSRCLQPPSSFPRTRSRRGVAGFPRRGQRQRRSDAAPHTRRRGIAVRPPRRSARPKAHASRVVRTSAGCRSRRSFGRPRGPRARLRPPRDGPTSLGNPVHQVQAQRHRAHGGRQVRVPSRTARAKARTSPSAPTTPSLGPRRRTGLSARR